MLGHSNLKNQLHQSVQEGTAGKKMIEIEMKFKGKRNKVEMLWSEPEPRMPNNYSTALCQFYALEKRFKGDVKLNCMY